MRQKHSLQRFEAECVDLFKLHGAIRSRVCQALASTHINHEQLSCVLRAFQGNLKYTCKTGVRIARICDFNLLISVARNQNLHELIR